MAVYAIGDLHLSLALDKPMDVFGNKWSNYVEKIEDGFSAVKPDDITVICGDVSWGINFEECLPDFRFIDSLPGRKILLKGNHDYYWSTMTKLREFLSNNNLTSIDFLNNNAFEYKDYSICGTRGWFEDDNTSQDLISHNKKLINREVSRLEQSLKSASTSNRIVFLHYPPIYKSFVLKDFIKIFETFNVENCYYGHLHSSGLNYAFESTYGNTSYKCVSADHIDFTPVRIIDD